MRVHAKLSCARYITSVFGTQTVCNDDGSEWWWFLDIKLFSIICDHRKVTSLSWPFYQGSLLNSYFLFLELIPTKKKKKQPSRWRAISSSYKIPIHWKNDERRRLLVMKLRYSLLHSVSHYIRIRHSDVPFFQGIVQVTSSFSKHRNSSLFSSFSAAGTVTFPVLFKFLYPHTRRKTSPLTAKHPFYILLLILLYFTAVLNYLILFYYNIT